MLDLGYGTGTLTILIEQSVPEAEVVGLDGDLKVLEIARSKAAKTGVNLRLDYGMADQLPYPDSLFDRVLSSLEFHHLVLANFHTGFVIGSPKTPLSKSMVAASLPTYKTMIRPLAQKLG